MCIQDNPRYIKLVEMGMPETSVFEYSWCSGKMVLRVVLSDIVSFCSVATDFTPEELFTEMFDDLEAFYATAS